MPTVPRQFVPQTSPQAGGDIGMVQAPGVEPVQNLAAAQQIRFGEAMTAAGDTMFRVGSAIQDAIDEAMTREADTKAIQSFNRMSAEYLNMTGRDAVEKYPQFQAQMGEVAKSVMDGLQNDTQKRMFSQIASRNMATYDARMMGHWLSQTKEWNSKEAGARAETYAQMAANTWQDTPEARNEFKVDFETAKISLGQALDIQGVPEGSAVRIRAMQNLEDNTAKSVVARLMDRKEFDQAESFLKETGASKTVVEDLRSRVKVGLLDVTSTNYAENILNYGSVEPPENGTAGTPPITLGEALDPAMSIADPELRRQTEAKVRREYAAREAVIRDGENTAYEQVLRMQLAGQSIPEPLLAAVSPQARSAIERDWAEASARRSDEQVRLEVAVDPSLLTEQWVMDNMTRMSPSTAIRLLEDARNPERVMSANVNGQLLESILYNNKLTELADPNRKNQDQVRRRLMLEQSISDQINVEQQELGRRLKPEEMRKVMERAVMQQVSVSVFGRDPQRLYGSLTTDEQEKAYVYIDGNEEYLNQIPKDEIPRIIDMLNKRGVDPTMVNVMRYWKASR